jgi:peptidoglycan/LPS O-acetylase OafA/YrhL
MVSGAGEADTAVAPRVSQWADTQRIAFGRGRRRAASIPAALITAALFHRLIDDPIQKWLTPRLTGTVGPAQAETPAAA